MASSLTKPIIFHELWHYLIWNGWLCANGFAVMTMSGGHNFICNSIATQTPGVCFMAIAIDFAWIICRVERVFCRQHDAGGHFAHRNLSMAIRIMLIARLQNRIDRVYHERQWEFSFVCFVRSQKRSNWKWFSCEQSTFGGHCSRPNYIMAYQFVRYENQYWMA